MEVAIQEKPFRKEAPVDSPLEEELASEIKGPAHITNGVLQEKWKPQQQL